MSHILASYNSKLIEYKEISRHNSLVNAMFALESLLSEYQITYGGTGFIKKYRSTPDKHQIKEGLYIIQIGINRLILFNRRRNIGYVWNDFDDEVVAEFVIICCRGDSCDDALFKKTVELFTLLQDTDDFDVHKSGMSEIFDLIVSDKFVLPPRIIMEDSVILKK